VTMSQSHTCITYVIGISSVCLSYGSTRLRCAKAAETTKMAFGVNNPGGPRNIVLHGGPDPPTARGIDAAFAKLLWPLVVFTAEFSTRVCNITSTLR